MEKPILIAIIEIDEKHIKDAREALSEARVGKKIPIDLVFFESVMEYMRFCDIREQEDLSPVQGVISAIHVPYEKYGKADPNGLRIAADCSTHSVPYTLITNKDIYSDNEYLWIGRLAEIAGIKIVSRRASSLHHKEIKDWWTAWCILKRALWHHQKSKGRL